MSSLVCPVVIDLRRRRSNMHVIIIMRLTAIITNIMKTLTDTATGIDRVLSAAIRQVYISIINHTLPSTIRALLVRVWPVIARVVASAIWLHEYM